MEIAEKDFSTVIKIYMERNSPPASTGLMSVVSGTMSSRQQV